MKGFRTNETVATHLCGLSGSKAQLRLIRPALSGRRSGALALAQMCRVREISAADPLSWIGTTLHICTAFPATTVSVALVDHLGSHRI
jgi:hypothetical protein